MLEVIPIRALKDNYIWIGINRELQQAFVVDPGDDKPVLAYLEKEKLLLTDVLITHKHADHTAGIKGLVNQFPQVNIYAHPLENISYATRLVHDQQLFKLSSAQQSCQVIHIPGHTHGHVAYYLKPALFSGDTLFSAGCGRLFEGTAEQMLHSLNKLCQLPDETLVYCGHEYTLNNLKFAAQVEVSNLEVVKRMTAIEKLIRQGKPSLPSTMQIEKLTNPFLRCKENSIISAVEKHAGHQLDDTESVFKELREWKNNF